MIGIVVISYNHFLFTSYCINSIIEHTDRDLYRLCLVDNGSVDDTRPWARGMLNDGVIDKFISNDSNLGACKAVNQGLIWCQENGYDTIVMANDHVVTPNWLQPIIDAPADHVNPFTFISKKELVDLDPITVGLREQYLKLRLAYLQHGIVREFNLDYVLKKTYSNFNKYVLDFRERHKEVPYVFTDTAFWHGFTYYSYGLVNKVGLRDEHLLQFTKSGGADLDYQYRVQLAGFKMCVCMQSYVHHWGSITTRKLGFSQEGFKDANQVNGWDKALNYLKIKHGFDTTKPLPKCFGM